MAVIEVIVKCFPYTTTLSEDFTLSMLSSIGAAGSPVPSADCTTQHDELSLPNNTPSSNCAASPVLSSHDSTAEDDNDVEKTSDGMALPSGLQTMVSVATMREAWPLSGVGRRTRHSRSLGRSGQAASWRQRTSANWRSGSSCNLFERLFMCCECVCVCVRERERERENVCVCVCRMKNQLVKCH